MCWKLFTKIWIRRIRLPVVFVHVTLAAFTRHLLKYAKCVLKAQRMKFLLSQWGLSILSSVSRLFLNLFIFSFILFFRFYFAFCHFTLSLECAKSAEGIGRQENSFKTELRSRQTTKWKEILRVLFVFRFPASPRVCVCVCVSGCEYEWVSVVQISTDDTFTIITSPTLKQLAALIRTNEKNFPFSFLQSETLSYSHTHLRKHVLHNSIFSFSFCFFYFCTKW